MNTKAISCGARLRKGFARRAKAGEESQSKLDEILLPHQAKRLKQLAVQYRLRSGTSRALSSSTISDALGISDEQKGEIREKSEEVQKELNEKIAELRREAQDKILQALTPQQRATWKEIVGEQFEFEQTRFNFGRGRGNRNERGDRPDSE